MLEIHGVPFSAHTRKVILGALEKGIPYQLVPVVPLKPPPPPGWAELSPLGKIPAIRDEGFAIADSSVILQYLERTRPQPALYPREPQQCARALWIEEYVDGALAHDVLHDVLLQKVFAPKFLGRPCDEQRVARAVTESIPPKFAYLEQALQGPYFVGEQFSVADLTVASILLNYHYAGLEVSQREYPKLHGFLRSMLERPSFKQALSIELPAAAEVGGLDLRLLQSVGFAA